MNIVILTSHVFLQGYRKASVHFVAQQWAAQGHRVHFVSVGNSWLTLIKNPPRYKRLSAAQGNRFADVAPNLYAAAYLPPLHAFSTRHALLNRMSGPMFRLYGGHIPRFMRAAVSEADLLVVESGTPICFYPALHRLNPSARTLYFCRDLLKTIGAAPALQRIEEKVISSFDLVVVPSPRIGQMLPPGGRVKFIPQGIDKQLFDDASVSPYAAGSRNAVAVGDMLFDQPAVQQMAQAAAEVDFHIFGVRWAGVVPDNVKIHGERDFASIVPYIRHADIGLAPYRVTAEDAYLTESSLKLLQYSYCRLPILIPDLIANRRGNIVGYAVGTETKWRDKIDQALAMPKSESFRDGILSWQDVARMISAEISATA